MKTSGKGQGASVLTPAKEKKLQEFNQNWQHFGAMQYSNETNLNDEVVAFLLIQYIARKEFKLDDVKSLCELIGASKTGKKSVLIIRLCEESNMTDVENYERLIDMFSRNTI